MIEVGVVGKVENEMAEIYIDTSSCENCDLKDHCRTKMKASLKAYTNNIKVMMGDKVEVEVPELIALKASLVVYGIPFVSFLSGFFIGYSISSIFGLIGGLSGLGISAFITKKVGKHFTKKNLPKIIKKLNIVI